MAEEANRYLRPRAPVSEHPSLAACARKKVRRTRSGVIPRAHLLEAGGPREMEALPAFVVASASRMLWLHFAWSLIPVTCTDGRVEESA